MSWKSRVISLQLTLVIRPTAFQRVVYDRILMIAGYNSCQLWMSMLNHRGHHLLFYGGISCQFMSEAHGEVGWRGPAKHWYQNVGDWIALSATLLSKLHWFQMSQGVSSVDVAGLCISELLTKSGGDELSLCQPRLKLDRKVGSKLEVIWEYREYKVDIQNILKQLGPNLRADPNWNRPKLLRLSPWETIPFQPH